MPAKPSVFISYRRSDSSTIAGRIYDRLTQAFGKAKVFKDSYNIAHGADFREVIETNVSRCNVVLVIIGPTWLTMTEKENPSLRRLDDSGDWVRFEIETGIQTSGTTVIPVLVQNAHMPKADELPETLRELAYKNATVVRDDPDFDTDIAGLIRELTPDKSDSRRMIFGLLLIVVALVTLFIFISLPKNPANRVISTDIPASTAVLELSRTPNVYDLVIGGQAKVHLSNGFKQLDVRTAASNASPVLDRLDEGEIVAILDGPVHNSDNSHWMKIRTPEGIDGWATVVLTDTQSLLPISGSR